MGTGTKVAVGLGVAAVVVIAGVLIYNAANPAPAHTTPQLGDGSSSAATGANAFDAFVAGINGATRITTAAIDANRRPATGTTPQNTGTVSTGTTATTGTTARTG